MGQDKTNSTQQNGDGAPDAKVAPAPSFEDFADDRDHLAVLPLAILPLETPALRHARMIKNHHLETVIEFFADEGTGSGQVDVFTVGKQFGWPDDNSHPDYRILAKLALLHSYDVYALRITLRQIGIPISDVKALQLSEEKAKQLTKYMTKFTRPLIRQIYGTSNMDIENIDQLLGLFRNPDRKKAMESLKKMADTLQIDIMDVPRFLEDFGDVFLSLSYYRQCMDTIEPLIAGFVDSLDDLRGNWQLKNDRHLMRTCDEIENTFNNLTAQITGRLENFDRSAAQMWDNLNAENFRKVQKLVESYHVTIGGVLCALWVKLHAWHSLFPKRDIGGPVRRADFIMSEIKPGLQTIAKIEDSAPMLASLAKKIDEVVEKKVREKQKPPPDVVEIGSD